MIFLGVILDSNFHKNTSCKNTKKTLLFRLIFKKIKESFQSFQYKVNSSHYRREIIYVLSICLD